MPTDEYVSLNFTGPGATFSLTGSGDGWTTRQSYLLAAAVHNEKVGFTRKERRQMSGDPGVWAKNGTDK